MIAPLWVGGAGVRGVIDAEWVCCGVVVGVVDGFHVQGLEFPSRHTRPERQRGLPRVALRGLLSESGGCRRSPSTAPMRGPSQAPSPSLWVELRRCLLVAGSVDPAMRYCCLPTQPNCGVALPHSATKLRYGSANPRPSCHPAAPHSTHRGDRWSSVGSSWRPIRRHP